MKKFVFALATLFLAVPALAQETAEAAPAAAPAVTNAVAAGVASSVGWVGLAVGIMMGLAVLGGTLGQSRAASTALDGIARNPAASDKFTVPLILSLALMESLVLFAFVIGFLLQGSIGAALAVIK